MPATESPRQMMAMANGLQWLAPEIDASLHRVRMFIDQQQEAEDSELETTAIQAELKLVLGALRMANCHGGALLTEELCAAVDLVAGGKLAAPAAALAAVSGATLQLSDYLDALRHAAPDRAAVLQPAIAELRLASGRTAATDADLFVQQMLRLDVQLPLRMAEPGAAASVVASKLLPAFQALLLQWLKGVDVANTLLKLRRVGDHVAAHATRTEVVLLWSAFAAAIDSLVNSPDSDSLELKRLGGRLGQQIKTLGEQGEDAAAAAAPEIAWRLLGHAAPISISGSRWLTLRHYLPLDATLPVEPALSQARQHLRGPNTSLLEKVADEVRVDLALVKDGLDLALRAGGLLPDSQQSIRERLGRIANTLLMLGLPQLEQVLRGLAGELETLGSGADENQGQWMRVATALLRVEHSLETALFRPLRQMRVEPPREMPAELIETVPHSQDLRESTNALLREMLVDIAKLKSQLDAYLKGAELRVAEEPVQLLSEVASGLLILDRLPAAGLSGQLRDWLRHATPGALRGDSLLAVRFAESIAALEIYLEALRDALPEPERMLETLAVAIDSFASKPAEPLPAVAMEPETVEAVPSLDEEMLLTTLVPPAPEIPSKVTAALLDSSNAEIDSGWVQAEPLPPATSGVESNPEVSTPVIEVAAVDEPPAALDTVAPLAAELPAVAVPEISEPSAVPAPPAGDDDPEIRQIFIEEAQEVFDSLKRQLPVFRRDPSEPNALGDIRRAFHTLKGSGRMVGATRIGEFGWAVEHLLNRCIEGALPINRAVVSLIDQAVLQLPGLLSAFSDNVAADDESQALVARAHFLASGRAPEMVEQEVLDVFRADSLDRLADLERWLTDTEHPGIDPDAVRALHTIKGSAAVVNFEPLSQLAGALEALLKQLVAAEAAMPPEVRAVFDEVLPVLKDWTLSSGQSMPPENGDWLARVEALKPFLPPPGDSRNLARRENLVNLAYDRLQLVEQSLVAWTLHPADAGLCSAMADAAEGLASVSQECLPLVRGAEALMARLRADDLAAQAPDSAFFLALANALEHFYQFLDAYREGGIRDSGRELAELLRALPLQALPAPTAEIETEAAPVFAEEAFVVAEAVAEPQTPEAPAWFAPEELAAPQAVSMPTEAVDGELAELFVEEARELIAVLKSETPVWQPPQPAPDSILHALHTLTGSARMTGFIALGDLAHGFERRIQLLSADGSEGVSLRAELLATLSVFEQAIESFAVIDNSTAEPLSVPTADAPEPAPPADEGNAFAAPLPFNDLSGLSESLPVNQNDAFVQALVDEGSLSGSLLDDGMADDAPAARPAERVAPAVPAAPTPILQPLPSLLEGMEQLWPDAAGTALGALVPRDMARVTSDADTAPAPDSIDPELANIFIAEASEMLETIDSALGDWRRDAGDPAAINELQRALHTLKGGARMTGFMQMGDVSHEMESRVTEILQRGHAPSREDHAALKLELETLERMHDALARGHYAEAVRVAEPVRQVFTMGEGDAEVDFDMPRPERVPAPSAEPVPVPEGWDANLFWMPVQDDAVASRRELARVPVETLDSMLNEAGEISIYRSRLEQQNAVLVNQLNEMRQTVVRLREQLRLMEIETDAQIAARGLNAQTPSDTPDRYAQDFDPLEMDRYSRMQELGRALAEAVGDLSSLHLTMDQGVAEAQALLLQQGRINTTVQQGLMGTLMVPFSRQVARLQRVVRQTAQEEGKFADVRFEGVESELDRNVLERMTAPLEHLLRNAVVHGLEDPAGRTAAGKTAMGTVSVKLKREGTQLVMEVADDGRGLNFPAIRTKAIERGLLPIGAELGDDEIARFIFEPGFSTAETLTQSAGRGVGMDVVASEVKQLGGSLELRSDTGQGTRFTVRLPLSLALSQTLMVKVGEEIYALPLVAIEGIGRVPRAAASVAAGGGEAEFGYAGNDYRVRYLAELIDLPYAVPEDSRTVPAVLVRTGEGIAGGERRVALVVDQLLGNREVVSKAVGPQLSSISGVAGATILPTGEVVLVLDPGALVIDRARRRLIAEAAANRAAMTHQASQGGRLIMVVDDSVTMRRVAERLLQRHGYRVITAKDGLDAIAMLQNESPAAILLDIEMPRADGFEVAGFVRHNERIQDTPIIMITSRSGDKHRTRAAALGVNRYLIKPYQEEQLLHELRALLQAREAEAG